MIIFLIMGYKFSNRNALFKNSFLLFLHIDNIKSTISCQIHEDY